MKKIFLVFILATMPIFVSADEATSTPTVASSTVTITIRNGSTTAFTGSVDIATSTTPAVDVTPTNYSTTVAVPADSLLATLTALDTQTTDFDITDLGYFPSYNSFIINCIKVPSAHATPDCYNWTYAVNGTFPQVGIDDTILHDGDIVFLFFGPPRQTTLSTSTARVGESFTATAQQYDLNSGNYVPALGVTLGVGTPNADFSFTELATSTINTSGQAIFTLTATGTYQVGIKEDFYFPSIPITITESVATSSESAPTASGNSPTQSSGGGGGISHSTFNISSALAFLSSKQNADGSFNSSMLSDWTAIAYSASDPGTSKTLLRNYLLIATSTFSSVTDYERRAMALMALGINPYTDTRVDVITQIVKAFDGTQIGDVHLDNDDIFAIFPLLRAGYSTDDVIIQKVSAFIISAQRPDGSWDGSVDMTAAAVQALEPLLSLPGVIEAKTRAISYLKKTQKDTGGWSDIDATSWASTANSAVAPSAPWTSIYGYYPSDALASAQASDGSARPSSDTSDMRVWSTGYAVTAASGKHWLSLLQSFPKPVAVTPGGGIVLGVATSSTPATTTPPIATSTPPLVTSTPLAIEHAPSIAISATTSATSTTTPSLRKILPTIPRKASKIVATTTSTPTPSAQIATANASGSTVLGKMWKYIISFFGHFVR